MVLTKSLWKMLLQKIFHSIVGWGEAEHCERHPLWCTCIVKCQQMVDKTTWLDTQLQAQKTHCSKGQLNSEWLFDVLNLQKTNAKIWWISALESKKLLNHKDKGTLLSW